MPSDSTLSANLRTESKEPNSSGQASMPLIMDCCSTSVEIVNDSVGQRTDPYTMLSLVALGLVTGGEKESVGVEFCKMNGCPKAETNICAGDNHRLVADIGIGNGNRRPLFSKKRRDGKLAHDGGGKG